MPELTNVDAKQKIANEIYRLVSELNIQIHKANDNHLGLNITVIQNSGMKPKNSDVCVFIDEVVSY